MRRIISALSFAVLLMGTMVVNSSAQNDKPDWQKHIDWAANDTGAPNCEWLYGTSNADCLAIGIATGNRDGNRSCLIGKAIIAAKAGYDQAAYGLTLITQCHNAGAAQAIAAAGPTAVADYLRTFQ